MAPRGGVSTSSLKIKNPCHVLCLVRLRDASRLNGHAWAADQAISFASASPIDWFYQNSHHSSSWRSETVRWPLMRS
jgi:hypothetical protein